MDSSSQNEAEEQITSPAQDRDASTVKCCGSCGCGFDSCGFDGIIRYGHDLLCSLRDRGVSQDNTTLLNGAAINPRRRAFWENKLEWLQRAGSGDSASSSSCCVSSSCVGNLVNQREEADISEHREQLKEQAKESLLRAHQAEHEIFVLQARNTDILDQLSTKEKELEMANRKIEIAEQDKEKRLRQMEEDLSTALKEKENMQVDMEQRERDLTRERDEALREKAALERPWWRRLVICQGKIPGSQCECLPDSTIMRRMIIQCCPMQLMRLQNLLPCGSCISCFPATASVGGTLTEQEYLPRLQRSMSETGVTDEPSSFSNPYRDPGRIDLINALLKSEWSYVSAWFEKQMRQVVEPLLQEQLAAIYPLLKIKIGHTCDLGDMPVQLENIMAETCTEVMPDGGEKIENLQIAGSLNYLGNAMVDVVVSGMGELGNLFINGLSVKGAVVIELVKLTHAPPWFSGVRIFFPNAPKVDIQVSTKLRVFGSVDGYTLGTVVKNKIVQALDEKVLGRTVVLPNRFCIGLGERMEDVSLRYPRPEGVLRLAVLRAQGLRNTRSGSSWYVPWSKKTADDENVNPYAVLTLGAERKQTGQCTKTLTPEWENQIFDFIVTDLDKQSLRITVRDHESGMFTTADHLLGRTEVSLLKLVDASFQQQGDRPHGRWINLYNESGWLRAGHVMIQSQWRPFARVNEITQAVTSLDNWWGVGVRSEVSWLLAADVFYASGLKDCEDGTEHWATMTISGFRRHDAPDVPETKETPVACAAGAFEHGLKVLSNIGIENGVMNEEETRQVGRKMWRRKVRLGTKADDLEKKGTRFVDVVWNCPLLFLMDRVQDVKVKITVLRPAKGGKTRLPGSNAVESLGSFEHTLSLVELGGRMTSNLHVALGDSGAEMKLRLQASPLMAPSSCRSEGGRLAPYTRLGQSAIAFCANRSFSADFSEATNAQAPDSLSFAPELPLVPEGSEANGIAVDAQAAQELPQQPRGWFSWMSSKSSAQPPAPAVEVQGTESCATAYEADHPSPSASQNLPASVPPANTASRWTWFTSAPRHVEAPLRDRAQSSYTCMDSEDEAIDRFFAETSDEEQFELVSSDAVPQISRFVRIRNWLSIPKPTEPTEESIDGVDDQIGIEQSLDDPNFQRQASGETACSKTNDTSGESELEANPEVDTAIADQTEPTSHEVITPSSWRIVNWWKGTGQAARKIDNTQAEELTMLRLNHSAPELTVPGVAEDEDVVSNEDSKQDSPLLDDSRERSPERTPMPGTLSDMPPTLHLRKNRVRVKRAASDSNLAGGEEEDEISNTRIAKDDLSVGCMKSNSSIKAEMTPPRRRTAGHLDWLPFRRKAEFSTALSFDALTETNNSISTPTMLSDSYDSALQTPAALSPARGEIEASSIDESPPEAEDVGDIAACQPPVFIGEVDTPPTAPKGQEDMEKVDPTVAEFGTPDMESKVDAAETQSPVKAVLSYFMKK